MLPQSQKSVLRKRIDKATAHGSHELVFPKLVKQDSGPLRIYDTPPTIFHQEESRAAGYMDLVADMLTNYRGTLAEDRRVLFDRYQLVDLAVKVVGIGSVGTLCLVALMMSIAGHLFFLQVKEANASVLEAYAGKGAYAHRAPLQPPIMIAVGATAAVVFASRAREGYFAVVVERTMASSGQFPMRLTICVLILLVVLSRALNIDMVLGAFAAGAIVRAALLDQHRENISLRLDGLGSAFLIPIFFITSGRRLDVASLFASTSALVMVPVYAALMLLVRGLPALFLYRTTPPKPQRIALAFHLGTQISLVVPITRIAVQRGIMSGAQGAAMVGGAILTTLVFPEVAARFAQIDQQATDRAFSCGMTRGEADAGRGARMTRPSRDWCPSGHRLRVHATATWSPSPVAPSAWGPIGIIPRRRPFIT
jgi:hypothetical protein